MTGGPYPETIMCGVRVRTAFGDLYCARPAAWIVRENCIAAPDGVHRTVYQCDSCHDMSTSGGHVVVCSDGHPIRTYSAQPLI